jgi:hypothetical protein
MNVRKLYTILIEDYKRYVIQIPKASEYPSLDEEDFSSQLTRFRDFYIKNKSYRPSVDELTTLADRLCNAEMELSTYQTVIRNFLSNGTPYNGLLLFHGLGTGKTCSAITVAEEHRRFLKQSGLPRFIYILGGGNLQSNFKTQFFQESNLIKQGDEWTYKGCVGNALLREINATNMTKEMIVEKINELIHRHYRFMGYRKFANYIQQLKHVEELEHSMIVIDEAHNIKDESKGFTPSKALDLVTKKTTVKLLLLSATPMFNDPGEIIWMLNLLNRNDKRYELKESDIFSNGELKESERTRLIHHMRGYVSFVKGENPFTFPYRIYPSYFQTKTPSPTKPFAITFDEDKSMEEMKTQVCPVTLQSHQQKAYDKVVQAASASKTLSMSDSFPLLTVLNMSYPEGTSLDYLEKFGNKYDYYKKTVRCFDPDQIGTYSAKIHAICEQIKKSEGIVLIYSQFLEEGVIPMALALESMGITSDTPLFKRAVKAGPYKYCMLTGRPSLTPHPEESIRILNSLENRNGDLLKVVLITKAASEGVDLKNVRQLHIMDPWWNLNRIEQIIGRGIRLCSHKNLPFEKRNAQIFLYTSYVGESETVDHYIYRFAEKKAKRIGKITRLLKENSIDCVMNHQVTSQEMLGLTVPQTLSTGEEIQYTVGDTSMSVLCDFMDCDYDCKCTVQEMTVEASLASIASIIERIRDLFRNGYVFDKNEIYDYMNKPVSMTQLEEALTQMVDLKLECWDLAHRKGYLIHRGKYFFFQPLHLPETIPVYERRILPYTSKHSITIEPKEKARFTNTSDLYKQIEQNMNESQQSGESWYGLAFDVKKKIKELSEKHGFLYDEDKMEQCIFDHCMELFIYADCLKLIQSEKRTPLEKRVEAFFQTHTKGNLLRVWNNRTVTTLTNKDGWKEYEDKYKPVLIPKEDFGTVVGGITNKGEETRVFKSKDMDDTTLSYGQICENAGLTTSLIPRIEKIFGDDYSGQPSRVICCELELLLRYLDKIQYRKKRWFLNAVEVIENNNDKVINLIKKLKT